MCQTAAPGTPTWPRAPKGSPKMPKDVQKGHPRMTRTSKNVCVLCVFRKHQLQKHTKAHAFHKAWVYLGGPSQPKAAQRGLRIVTGKPKSPQRRLQKPKVTQSTPRHLKMTSHLLQPLPLHLHLPLICFSILLCICLCLCLCISSASASGSASASDLPQHRPLRLPLRLPLSLLALSQKV